MVFALIVYFQSPLCTARYTIIAYTHVVVVQTNVQLLELCVSYYFKIHRNINRTSQQKGCTGNKITHHKDNLEQCTLYQWEVGYMTGVIVQSNNVKSQFEVVKKFISCVRQKQLLKSCSNFVLRLFTIHKTVQRIMYDTLCKFFIYVLTPC